MNRIGTLPEIQECIARCRAECEERDTPFYADALAAALGVPFDTLARYAAGEETSAHTAQVLSAALQECTASVLSFALRTDQKQNTFLMWYLRNRAGFSDKGETARAESGAVTFVGESRI